MPNAINTGSFSRVPMKPALTSHLADSARNMACISDRSEVIKL